MKRKKQIAPATVENHLMIGLKTAYGPLYTKGKVTDTVSVSK